MAEGRIKDSELSAIAAAIRSKNGESTIYKPGEMAAAIQAIPTGITPTGTVNITQNGTTDVTQYASAAVNVPNSYVAADEGKVVQSGALVAQTSLNVMVNGAYDTTINNSVVVNVDGGNMMSGTTPPTADMGSDGYYYKQLFPLPSDVDFVEYLQSSGTQYIDTGIIANQGTDLACDLEYRGNDFIIGCRTGSATNASKSLMLVGSERGLCAYKSFSAHIISDFALATSTGTRCKSIIKTAHSNATSVAILTPRNDVSTDFTNSFSNFTADYSQVLFGLKQGSTPTKGSAKLYRITYYQYGIPIADYLPCLDGDGVACMWDNIAGEYVYNDGTGSFSYGSTTTPTPLEDVIYRKVNGAWVVVGE